jgi:hypothetical protein
MTNEAVIHCSVAFFLLWPMIGLFQHGVFYISFSRTTHCKLQPWVTTVHRRLASSSNKLTMYFDDVSRHSNGWKPGNKLSKNSDVSAFHRSEQKHDALKRTLLGHDAESASVLSNDEGTFLLSCASTTGLPMMAVDDACLTRVLQYILSYDWQTTVLEQMQLWVQKYGVVGDDSSDDKLYRETLGMSVCGATSVVGCIADFWQAIVAVIDEHTDDVDPTRWTIKTSENLETKSQNLQLAEQIYFAVFPNCQELYDYKTMFTFVTAMELSKGLCLHLGNRLSLTLFHPKFKNSPRMLSPEKHSPFPCTGLQLGEPPSLVSASESTPPKATRRKSGTLKKPVSETKKGDSHLIGGRIQDLDEQRSHFEALFNSAAVSGSDGDDSVVSLNDIYAEELVDSLPKSFENEQQLSKSNLPKSRVKGMLKTWFNRNRYTDTGQRQQNRALQFIDTVADERWVISEHEIAEKVYADIWKAINDLYDVGCRAEKEYEARMSKSGENRSDDTKEKSQTSSQFDFVKTNSQPSLSGRGATDDQQRDGAQPVIQSSIFVSTKFCAFNAQTFKRFAITINAALKRLTNGQMFLEVFHPEYVGKKGYNSVMRQSPFPMIQICYVAKAEA